jgi:mycothiol synthase
VCSDVRGDKGDAVTVARVLDRKTIAQIFDLLDAAEAADGVAPVSEHALLQIKHGAPATACHLVLPAREGGVAGYAHLDRTDLAQGPVAELVVHPRHRRRGVAKILAARLGTLAADERLRLWAHGDHPGAAAFAAGVGFRSQRTLWNMRRSLTEPLPTYALTPAITVMTFHPGRDEEPWVALNARAFADHPEQGRLTLDDLHQRMAEPWFDPKGFFLAWRGDELVGFHWTKVHVGLDRPDVGEVYVLGIAPEEQRKGLGRALTVIGLEHLRDQGLDEVMLYVDGDNEAAIRTYSALGFRKWAADVLYGR